MLFAKFTLFAVLIVLASAGNPYRRERESGERGIMRESGERGKMRESGERHEYGVHSYKRSCRHLDLTGVKGQPHKFWRCAAGDKLIMMRCADHLIWSNKLRTCTWARLPVNKYGVKESREHNVYRAESGERQKNIYSSESAEHGKNVYRVESGERRKNVYGAESGERKEQRNKYVYNVRNESGERRKNVYNVKNESGERRKNIYNQEKRIKNIYGEESRERPVKYKDAPKKMEKNERKEEKYHKRY